MTSDHSINFFDRQFQRQASTNEQSLNPFEIAALPHLRGRVLDFGCGMGNLAAEAARRGCSVLAIDGSATAVAHLQGRAQRESLSIEAVQADLRNFPLAEDFDVVVSIGLLMFFDTDAAQRTLAMLQACVREGGVAIINVLVEGTTYLDMFDPNSYCLFSRSALAEHFSDWQVHSIEYQDFEVPGPRIKSFATVIAQKPSGI